MFLGTYRGRVDKRRRINLPAKLCKELGKVGVLVLDDKDYFLSIYSEEGFKRILEGLTLEEIRGITSKADRVSFDKQGRFIIPKQLRNAPLLNKLFDEKEEIVILGVFDHLEIWNRKRWEEKETPTLN